jgi:GT2 family glycosyltransferase
MITLCICTWNRCQSLRKTLNSILRLEGLGRLTEVLIVDNNSTDATVDTVDAFSSVLPIRYVLEKAQGLSHARNRAIKEFRGDVLLFTDDDVSVDVNWLSAYTDAISKFATAQYFGGRILPLWNTKPPRWLREPPLSLLDGVLGWYDHGLETRPYDRDEPVPFGASFALRREIFESTKRFRCDLGVSGTVRGRGEETELLQRCKAMGALGIYVGRSLCWHAVDPERLSVASLFRYGIESGAAQMRMDGGTKAGSNLVAAGQVARGLFQLATGRGDRFRQCIVNAGIQTGRRGAGSGYHPSQKKNDGS